MPVELDDDCRAAAVDGDEVAAERVPPRPERDHVASRCRARARLAAPTTASRHARRTAVSGTTTSCDDAPIRPKIERWTRRMSPPTMNLAIRQPISQTEALHSRDDSCRPGPLEAGRDRRSTRRRSAW